ncbi:MAG: Ig-like domain-containing protein, partial [Ruthenibacterium sp.]
NKTKLLLIEGDSETLTATVLPENATDKTVTWTSSNAAVATVANGKVTAVKAGTATITAKTANGKSATCAVTVTAKKPDVVDVTGITLNETAFSLIVGENKTVTATVLPANATDKTVTWTSSNAAAASVENGKVTALKVGKTTITATANGKTATCEVLVKAVPEPGVAGFVERLYSVALGRESDAGGKAAWTDYLKQGKVTGADVARDFILSKEMNNRNLSNEEFMSTIYETFFNRAPDAGGMKGWMNFLDNGLSREFVVSNFAGGAEFQNICDEFGIKRGSIPAPQP